VRRHAVYRLVYRSGAAHKDTGRPAKLSVLDKRNQLFLARLRSTVPGLGQIGNRGA
jgi:hypothetical protein